MISAVSLDDRGQKCLGSCIPAVHFLSVSCTVGASLTTPFPLSFALCQFWLPFYSLDCLLPLPLTTLLIPMSLPPPFLFPPTFCFVLTSSPSPLWFSGSEQEIWAEIPVEIRQSLCVYSARLCLRARLVSVKAICMPSGPPVSRSALFPHPLPSFSQGGAQGVRGETRKGHFELYALLNCTALTISTRLSASCPGKLSTRPPPGSTQENTDSFSDREVKEDQPCH